MVSPDQIAVEVAYANPAQQLIIPVHIDEGSTAEQAIRRSGILEKFPEIDLALNKVGVFGKILPLTTILQAGDRVEIYRPLRIDPKQARKTRAKSNKTRGKKT